MYKNIVLAYDGSLASQEALINCKDLSQLNKSNVHLLAVIPYDLVSIGPETAYYSEEHNKIEHERYTEILNDGVSQLRESGASALGELRKGDPVGQIVEYATEISADLIILGHKHRDSWIERWWRGSISKVLIEHAPCSVLVAMVLTLYSSTAGMFKLPIVSP